MNCSRCQRPIAKGQKYYRTKRGAHHETCPAVQALGNQQCSCAASSGDNPDCIIHPSIRVEPGTYTKGDTIPANFEGYLAECLNRAIPVIDHSLRAERLPDGRIKFYIHPANADGDTPDFVVNGNVLLNWPE